MTSPGPLSTGLAAARCRSDQLFGLIDPRALYERPIPERHRLIFYLGHLEAFDWNQICRGALSTQAFHAEFDRLFEFGIDPPVGSQPVDTPSDWPSEDEVRRYGGRVREAIDRLLPQAPDQIVHVAIEHRLMHLETLAYLVHQLAPDQKSGPLPALMNAPALRQQMLEIPGATVTLGRNARAGFGWDNEFEEHSVAVPGFAIGRHKVSNGEYLEFVEAGGPAPLFWVRRGQEWFYRAMFGEIPLPRDWPVYATHQEAAAYAAWKGLALPTEPQWHRAAFGSPASDLEFQYAWGDSPPEPSRGNFHYERWDPVAVDATPLGDSAFGVSQMIGNGWEWTSTPFQPFPGFAAFPFYPGYSAAFFDGQHFVLKGASARTDAKLLRRSFRNWFRPDYPYAYAGFRCVAN